MAIPLPQAGAMTPQPQRGGLGSFLFGSGPTTQQFNRFAPNQQQLQNQSINQALSLLGQVGQPISTQGFEPIAQQARQQFQTQTVPTLAERFTAMGGGQRSSAFPAALGSAGAQLESNLGALGAQYGLQERGQQQQLLSQLLGYGLTPSYETVHSEGQPGFLQSVLSPLAGGLGQALPLLLGGGPAAAGGLGLLQILSSLLGSQQGAEPTQYDLYGRGQSLQQRGGLRPSGLPYFPSTSVI